MCNLNFKVVIPKSLKAVHSRLQKKKSLLSVLFIRNFLNTKTNAWYTISL